jgi:hypothetical protein
MPVTVFSPLNLDILSYIGGIVAVIDGGLKTKIAKICSYGDLGSCPLGLLPYELVPITVLLAKIARIAWISIT